MTDKIKNKFEEITNEKVQNMTEITEGHCNKIHKIQSDKNTYIFRIFPSKEWPEEGKLKFINKKLIEKGVPCSKIIYITYDDKDIEQSFMIEEFIHGENASHHIDKNLSKEEFYSGIAKVVARIHEIQLVNYGGIGFGNPPHKTFYSYIKEDVDKFSNTLIEQQIFNEKEIGEIKEIIFKNLSYCENLPSTICHRDIYSANVIIQDSSMILIDWESANASVWIHDFAIMTYWIQLYEKPENYLKFRNNFLDNYQTKYMIDNLEQVEVTFHLITGMFLVGHFVDNKERCNQHLNNLYEILDRLK